MLKQFPSPYIPVYLLLAAFLLAFLGYNIVSLNAVSSVRQARFNVDVLERFIKAYTALENVHVQSLEDLPDFDIVSREHGLSVSSKDFKQGVAKGYIYDYQALGVGRFVISASPAGLFSPFIEIGITDKGELRFNDKGVDVDADSYFEIEGWKPVARFDRYRTRDLPEYMKQ